MSDDQVPLLASVDRTVADLATVDADAALVHLAQLYARQIDHAAAVARFADRLIARVEREDDGEDPTLLDMVNALRAKLSERDTLDRIGARLHAALVELGATPKARATAGGSKPPAAGPSTLAGLRVAGGATA